MREWRSHLRARPQLSLVVAACGIHTCEQAEMASNKIRSAQRLVSHKNKSPSDDAITRTAGAHYPRLGGLLSVDGLYLSSPCPCASSFPLHLRNLESPSCARKQVP